MLWQATGNSEEREGAGSRDGCSPGGGWNGPLCNGRLVAGTLLGRCLDITAKFSALESAVIYHQVWPPNTIGGMFVRCQVLLGFRANLNASLVQNGLEARLKQSPDLSPFSNGIFMQFSVFDRC